MMNDRRALLIGNWQSERESVSHQKVRSLLDRWESLLSGEGLYPFGSITNADGMPDRLENPTFAQLSSILRDQAFDIAPSTQLLIYYVGHSVPDGDNDIRLSLNKKEGGQTLRLSFSELLQWVQESSIKKLIVVLDTCHTGRIRKLIDNFNGDIFAMVATGTGYAFEAGFSDRLLRTLERSPHRGDLRIDLKAGGMTYARIFELARAPFVGVHENGEYKQLPESFGTLGAAVLLEAPPSVPDEYSPYASERSIYGRLFGIIKLTEEEDVVSESELVKKVRSRGSFLIRRGNGDEEQYVSRDRIRQYVNFMRRAGFLVSQGAKLWLSERGRQAASRDSFNRILLQTIEEQILPMPMSELNSIVKELLDNMVPTTPAKIQERAQMKGIEFPLDETVRFAIQVLPNTGRFMKASADSLFPAEFKPA